MCSYFHVAIHHDKFGKKNNIRSSICVQVSEYLLAKYCVRLVDQMLMLAILNFSFDLI